MDTDNIMFASGDAVSYERPYSDEESALVRYARRELALVGDQDSPEQQMANENILQMVSVFANQGNSGFSSNYILRVLDFLLHFMPLLPLTGEDSEWNDLDQDDGTDQNNRCSAVFRTNHDNSTAYYLYGKIFSDDDGETWQRTKDSCIPVVFPYSPPMNPEEVLLPIGSLNIEE